MQKNKNTYKLYIMLAVFITVICCSALIVAFGMNFSKAVGTINSAEIISLTKSERSSNGLPALITNTKLNDAAMARAQHMIDNDYFSHIAPDGKTFSDFLTEEGYTIFHAAENLASGYSTSAELINAWMNSPSHRDNILDSRFYEIGVAVLDGKLLGADTNVIVAMYGAESDSPPALDLGKADINADRRIDIVDLSILLSKWG